MPELSEQNNFDKIKQLLYSNNKDDSELALILAKSIDIDLKPVTDGLKRILSVSKVTPRIKDWENAADENLIQVVNEIQSLSIENIEIEFLPDEIGLFKNLFLIEIHGAGLRTLNPNIKYIRNLISLSLKNNSIEKLPEEITQLSFLKTLNLNKNLLKELPENIGEMHNLSLLELSNNPYLHYLPDSIQFISSLKKLVLDEKGFKGQIPLNISHLNKNTKVLWEEIKPLFKF